MYDDYMLCKVTLGVLKGTSKLNVLLLLLLFHAKTVLIAIDTVSFDAVIGWTAPLLS